MEIVAVIHFLFLTVYSHWEFTYWTEVQHLYLLKLHTIGTTLGRSLMGFLFCCFHSLCWKAIVGIW